MALRRLIASLVLVVGAAGAARADDRDPVAMQLEAEALEKDAKATRDFAKYVECGKAYLALADRMAGARATDEMLYNAGVCFEEGKAIGLALQMFARIMKDYSRSRIAPKAMARSAMLHMDTASYERAAELFEKYAKMYAGEKDAFHAASDAAFLYRAIGNRAKWIEITMFFVKAFGTKRVAEAGEAWFALTAAYDGDYESQRKHLLEYLRRFSSRDNDRALIAAAKLGIFSNNIFSIGKIV